MKEKYERIELTVTRFSGEDVITTSDRNNASFEQNVFEGVASTAKEVPTLRTWY